MTRDWAQWHDNYDGETWQAQRLATVQDRIRDFLDRAPASLSIISICAGQGRDLLPVLHERRKNAQALLVESDARNAKLARLAATSLPGVRVVHGNAAYTNHYANHVPADLVLVCGVLPHLTEPDRRSLLNHLPAMVRRGGEVIWTMHRRVPDAVPGLTSAFMDRGFAPLWLTPTNVEHAVCVAQRQWEPLELKRGKKMFTFVGIEAVEKLENN